MPAIQCRSACRFSALSHTQVLASYRADGNAGSYAEKFITGLRAVVEPMLRAGLGLGDDAADVWHTFLVM